MQKSGAVVAASVGSEVLDALDVGEGDSEEEEARLECLFIAIVIAQVQPIVARA